MGGKQVWLLLPKLLPLLLVEMVMVMVIRGKGRKVRESRRESGFLDALSSRACPLYLDPTYPTTMRKKDHHKPQTTNHKPQTTNHKPPCLGKVLMSRSRPANVHVQLSQDDGKL